ncbi:MAG: nucleoside deaminase [Pirellulaceae bacterium]|nr:nucleoside deaminase [Pirellulaceae bacterium]
MDEFFIHRQTPATDNVLNIVAHLPTTSLAKVIDAGFFERLSDADFMRIAVLLAQKSYEEGGCPIGGVVVHNTSRQILGKGHNTLVQENHPYNHGETSAMRDAGSIDFSQTTMFTTLTPCNVCACLLVERGFARVVIGNSPNESNNEAMLRSHGVQVELVPDPRGIELYSRFQREQPELDRIDWRGVAALRK